MLDHAVINAVLKRALRTGADFAEIFIERNSTQTLNIEDGKLETVSSGQDRGAGVRVIKGGRTGYALTNVLTPKGLVEAASAAAASWAGSGAKVAADLRRAEPQASHPVEEDPFGVPAETKAGWLWAANESARSRGNAIRQVMVGLAQQRQRVLIANSDGLLAEDDRTRVRFSIQVVAQAHGDMQRAFDSLAAASGLELIRNNPPEKLASAVADEAILKLSSIACPAGEMPVVIGARSAGVLFHEACGHPCEADGIVRGTSVYEPLMGMKIAPDFVTIVDDATVKNAWGSFAIDDEGTPAQRTVVVENGVLSSYLIDRMQGQKLGRSSTGNGRRQSYEHIPIPRMTNTFLEPRDADPEEIIKDTRNGIWVGKMAGGQVNPVSGDFVFGADEAFLIENGELTKPIHGTTLIGDGPTILSRIDVVGSDFIMGPGTCGKFGQFAHAGTGQPTLRVSKLTVGGTG